MTIFWPAITYWTIMFTELATVVNILLYFVWKIFPFRISTDCGHIIRKHLPYFNKTSETIYSSKLDPVTSSTWSRSPTNTALPLASCPPLSLQPHTFALSILLQEELRLSTHETRGSKLTDNPNEWYQTTWCNSR